MDNKWYVCYDTDYDHITEIRFITASLDLAKIWEAAHQSNYYEEVPNFYYQEEVEKHFKSPIVGI